MTGGSTPEGAGFLAAGWAQATLAVLVAVTVTVGGRRRRRWLLPAVVAG